MHDSRLPAGSPDVGWTRNVGARSLELGCLPDGCSAHVRTDRLTHAVGKGEVRGWTHGVAWTRNPEKSVHERACARGWLRARGGATPWIARGISGDRAATQVGGGGVLTENEIKPMGFSMNLRNPLKSGEIRRNSRKIRVARGETLRFPAWVRNSQNSSVHPPAKIRKFAHFVERQGKVSTLPKSGEMHILVKDRGKTGTCVKTTENPRKFSTFWRRTANPLREPAPGCTRSTTAAY